MTDRVRESLFGILADRVAGAKVLDLFAGSGSLGIEALSRGADRAAFLEKNGACIAAIRRNLMRALLASRARIIRGDVWRSLRRIRALKARFDLVFCDPPYAMTDSDELAARTLAFLSNVANAGLLASDCSVVVHHRKQAPLPEETGALAMTGRRQYGSTALTFYARRAPAGNRESGEGTGETRA